MKDELNLEGQSLLGDEKLDEITGGAGRDPNAQYSDKRCSYYWVWKSDCSRPENCPLYGTDKCVDGYEKI